MQTDRADERLILVPYRKAYRVRRFMVLAVFSVVAAVVGFAVGRLQISVLYRQATDTRAQLEERVEQLSEENVSLRQQVTNLERGGAVERHASVGVQQTIKDLQDEVNQLRGDVSFYKSIMAPSENTVGLQVQKLEVMALSANRYGYKLVLAQVGGSKNYLDGVVAVSVVGTRKGEQEVLTLRDLSEVQSLGVKFHFRYYQEFMGEWTVPADFVPETVQVVAQADGKRGARVETAFPWQVTENKANVGKK